MTSLRATAYGTEGPSTRGAGHAVAGHARPPPPTGPKALRDWEAAHQRSPAWHRRGGAPHRHSTRATLGTSSEWPSRRLPACVRCSGEMELRTRGLASNPDAALRGDEASAEVAATTLRFSVAIVLMCVTSRSTRLWSAAGGPVSLQARSGGCRSVSRHGRSVPLQSRTAFDRDILRACGPRTSRCAAHDHGGGQPLEGACSFSSRRRTRRRPPRCTWPTWVRMSSRSASPG